MDVKYRHYSVLAALQGLMGAVIVTATSLVYAFEPESLQNASLTMAMAISGAIAGLYYISLHQFLKKNYLKGSTIALSVISGINVLLVVMATGGLDSPYYALWLLALVIAGFFGMTATWIVFLITAGYFGYVFWQNDFSRDYIVGHLGALIMTLATAIIAEWIHRSLGRSAMQHAAVTKLSGKLTAESLKSEAIMQSVGEGVLVVDTNRRIQLFNPAAVNLTGWDVSTAQGIDYRLVLNLRGGDGNKLDDNSDPMTNMWQQGKNLVRNDLTMETKGGKKISITLSLSPLYDTEHKVSGGIGLFRDISAEKEVERQRNEFISTASHEMRTPVAAIEGYLSLAMNSSVATIDERAKQYLEKAHSSTKHLGDLFRDLLSITKIEDKHEGGEEFVDLTKMVQDTVDDMKFEASKKKLEIQFGPDDQHVRGEQFTMPVYAVKANPQRLREVIMNLIENAIKFTSEGSVRVTIGGNDQTATVSVIDTGIGIASEDISHLFQKFYRIDNSSTRTIGGTGLGLYLCRSIIERAGGKIWVESTVNQGSAFKFSLPRQASEKIKKEDEVVQSAPSTKGQIPAYAAAANTESTAGPVPAAPMPAPAATVAAPAAPVPPITATAPGAAMRIMNDIKKPA